MAPELEEASHVIVLVPVRGKKTRGGRKKGSVNALHTDARSWMTFPV